MSIDQEWCEEGSRVSVDRRAVDDLLYVVASLVEDALGDVVPADGRHLVVLFDAPQQRRGQTSVALRLHRVYIVEEPRVFVAGGGARVGRVAAQQREG